jgi:hypothetical protein
MKEEKWKIKEKQSKSNGIGGYIINLQLTGSSSRLRMEKKSSSI